MAHRRSFTLAATQLAALACSAPEPSPVPWEVQVIQGPPALSTPGERFDTVVVKLEDRDGRPVADWRVDWSGDGVIKPLDDRTDMHGMTRVIWTLPRHEPQRDFWVFGGGPSGTFSLTLTAAGGLTHSIVTEARTATARQIDVSVSYACGIRDGKLWCWGGVYSVAGREWSRAFAPFPLPAGITPTLVRTSEMMLCILDQQSIPWCTRYGDAGSWHRVDQAPPLAQLNISGDPWLHGEACGIAASDGMIWCWPAVADGTSIATATGFGPFTQIHGRWDTTCGIATDHTAWCWGDNSAGQLGDGTTTPSPVPVQVIGGHLFDQISAGYHVTCGRTIAGEIWCWGTAEYPKSAPLPSRIEAPWAHGAKINVGYNGEVYLQTGPSVRIWWEGEEITFLDYSAYTPVEFVAYGSVCLRQPNDELYCSEDILYGLISESILTAPVTAVPLP